MTGLALVALFGALAGSATCAGTREYKKSGPLRRSDSLRARLSLSLVSAAHVLRSQVWEGSVRERGVSFRGPPGGDSPAVLCGISSCCANCGKGGVWRLLLCAGRIPRRRQAHASARSCYTHLCDPTLAWRVRGPCDAGRGSGQQAPPQRHRTLIHTEPRRSGLGLHPSRGAGSTRRGGAPLARARPARHPRAQRGARRGRAQPGRCRKSTSLPARFRVGTRDKPTQHPAGPATRNRTAAPLRVCFLQCVCGQHFVPSVCCKGSAEALRVARGGCSQAAAG